MHVDLIINNEINTFIGLAVNNFNYHRKNNAQGDKRIHFKISQHRIW